MAQSIQHDRYPKFVADQVLTEKSLNQMFGYLEEQQRLTRSTLIGIGVMCGMEVRPAADSTSLTITQGVGVTSKGYLVPFPETTYAPFFISSGEKPSSLSIGGTPCRVKSSALGRSLLSTAIR